MPKSENYIAFLRGINVGKGRAVPMADLRALLEDLGLKDVSTYIQSGNVAFAAPAQDLDALQKKLAQRISGRFGFDIPVCIRKKSDLKKLLDASPFGPKDDAKRTYVLFLDAEPRTPPKLPVRDAKGEAELVSRKGRDVFARPLTDERGKGNPHAFAEKTFGVAATARNMNTVREMAK